MFCTIYFSTKLTTKIYWTGDSHSFSAWEHKFMPPFHSIFVWNKNELTLTTKLHINWISSPRARLTISRSWGWLLQCNVRHTPAVYILLHTRISEWIFKIRFRVPSGVRLKTPVEWWLHHCKTVIFTCRNTRVQETKAISHLHPLLTYAHKTSQKNNARVPNLQVHWTSCPQIHSAITSVHNQQCTLSQINLYQVNSIPYSSITTLIMLFVCIISLSTNK